MDNDDRSPGTHGGNASMIKLRRGFHLTLRGNAITDTPKIDDAASARTAFGGLYRFGGFWAAKGLSGA
jgi:hypothetical protein